MRKFLSAIIALFAIMCLSGFEGWGQYSLTGTSYSQDFNGLGTATGDVTGGNLNNRNVSLNGWYFLETGSNGNTTITAGTGSGNGGDTYNFGLAANADRTLGGLQSGTVVPSFGFYFTNNTGSTITELAISYTGKTWRVGTASRSDQLDFAYSSDATSLSTGTWSDFNNLDYANPGQATGNGTVQHSATITNTITGLTIGNGTTFFIRWTDFSASGADDGMGIDDLSITATVGSNPSVAISEEGILAGNVNQGDLNVVLQRYDLAVTDADATINGLTVTTAGTYIAADISNLKAWYSADNTFNSATDVLLSTKTTSLDAGAQAFPSFTTQAITSGTTGYIFVTTDVAASATPGSTINIATTAFADISFSGTVNKTGTDPVAAAGAKTFQAVTPDVALSSPSPAVAAASITQNTTNNVIYRFDLAITTANATLDGVTITTTGSYAAADLTNLKAWYSADNSFDAGDDVLLSEKTTSLDAGSHVFPTFSTQVINNGNTGHIFITTDIPCTATNGNTITVSAITTGDISFVSANESGTANAGGEQTIASATPADVTGAGASNLNASSSVSWSGPTGCSDEIMIVASASAPNNGTPSGDGSAYTANLAYGTGTALGNGFVVYKGAASPQVVTNLTNDVTYHFKIFTRNDENWSAGVEVTATPALQVQPGDIVINQLSQDYGGSSDEYIELVNLTGTSIDLSSLKISYQAGTGGAGGAGGNLTGTIPAHGFWLLSPNATVTVGLANISSDGSFSAGMAAASGQIALLRISDDVKIDGVGYGNVTGGTYAEGTAATVAPSDGGIRRVIDGADADANSTDFTTVTNANIYLRNSSSRLANTGASIAAGTYTDISVTGNSSIAGAVDVTGALTMTNGTFTTGANNLSLGVSASATLGAGTTLSITGGTTNFNGRPVTLRSTSLGTASIGQISGTLSGASNVTVERFIGFGTPKKAWRMVSSPVSGVNLFDSWQEAGVNNAGYGTLITGTGGGFDAGNASIKTWSANTWSTSQIAATNTGDISDYQGYMLFVRGDRSVDINPATTATNTTLRATGNVRQGTMAGYITVANTITNFTLVGNPYPSAISFEAINAAYPTLINFYSWDPSASGANGVGAYNYVERNGGTYRVTPHPFPGTPSNNASAAYIPLGAAVLIEGPAAGGDVVVSMQESFKTSNTTTVNYFRTSSTDRSFAVNLVRSNTTLDGLRICFDNSYVNDVTDDATKLWNNTENMSLSRNGSFFIVERRKDITANDTAFVKIYNLPQDSYQLDFYPDQFNGLQAFLVDAYTNTSTPIDVTTASNYPFVVNADAASKAADRFMIVFRPSSVLPVSFTAIRAYEKGNAIEVAWNVAGESDIHHYEVEKSADGRNFSTIASVKATGNENSSVHYTSLDIAPVSGNNYYRVKSVSMSNEVKYTSIVNVKLGKEGRAISVYPNPVKGNTIGLQLTNLEKGSYTVNVYNTNGQLVVTKMIQHGGGAASEQLSLPASATKGVYQLEVRGENSRYVQAIILQ